MTIDEMIEALETARDEHGGEIEIVMEAFSQITGMITTPVADLVQATRQVTRNPYDKRNRFVRTEKSLLLHHS